MFHVASFPPANQSSDIEIFSVTLLVVRKIILHYVGPALFATVRKVVYKLNFKQAKCKASIHCLKN